MTRAEIDTIVREVLADALGRPIAADEPVSQDTDGAWDSVKHIDILFMLEDAFGFTFTEEEMPDLRSLRGIVDRTSARLGVVA